MDFAHWILVIIGVLAALGGGLVGLLTLLAGGMAQGSGGDIGFMGKGFIVAAILVVVGLLLTISGCNPG